MVFLVPICCLQCLILLLLWTILNCWFSLNLVGLSLMYWYTVNTVDKDMIRLLLLSSISFFTLHTIGKCLSVSGVCLRWVWQAIGGPIWLSEWWVLFLIYYMVTGGSILSLYAIGGTMFSLHAIGGTSYVINIWQLGALFCHYMATLGPFFS